MDIETSLMVDDYPEQPEPKTKEISGRIAFIYKFKTEVPEDWDIADIKQDIWENVIDYQQDLDDIDVDI